MDRELMLATLACLLCGPLLLAAGAVRTRAGAAGDERAGERAAWRRIWLPLRPAALVLAFLAGWAIQEPEAAEGMGPALAGAAALFSLVAVRALVRAARALRAPARGAVAMTAGLLRPRVFIAPELAARLDERALRAALEHEAAHARHRDPLRLWLAQLATDLQWPMPAARRRFADWRGALELARDAEACERVDGSDLAAALIEAARLCRGARGAAVVGLVADAGARAFADRIHRLLDRPRGAGGAAAPASARRPPRARARAWALVGAALGLAIVLGGLYGEALIGLLPGLGA
jgi:hypothetical protein